MFRIGCHLSIEGGYYSMGQRIIKMGELSGAEVDVKKSEVIFFKSIWAKQIVECYDCGAELTVNDNTETNSNY